MRSGVIALVLLGVAGAAWGIAVCPTCQNATFGTDPGKCGTRIPGEVSICSPSPFPCTPPGFYPVGTYLFFCTTSSGTCQYTITVKDTKRPIIACAENLVVPETSGAGAIVTFQNPTASDNCGSVTVSSNPPSGSLFPPGMTTVTQTATDTAGNTSTCKFTVTVLPPGAVPATSRWMLVLMASALAVAGALALRFTT